MIAGIDLSASFDKPSHCAWLESGQINIQPLFTNHEISEFLHALKITRVGLDAPLSLPRGLNGKFGSRKCERDLLRLKIPVLATSLLAPLTFRAIQLREMLEERGITCYEVFPFAVRKVKMIEPEKDKQKKADLAIILQALVRQLPFSLPESGVENDHELDAILALWMVKMIEDAQVRTIGDQDEGLIFIPMVP